MSDIDIQSLNNFLDPTKNNDKVKDKLNFFANLYNSMSLKVFIRKETQKL